MTYHTSKEVRAFSVADLSKEDVVLSVDGPKPGVARSRDNVIEISGLDGENFTGIERWPLAMVSTNGCGYVARLQ